MSEQPKCKTCRWWDQELWIEVEIAGEEDDFDESFGPERTSEETVKYMKLGAGFCKGVGPLVRKVNDPRHYSILTWARWPEVGEDEWCRLHQERP